MPVIRAVSLALAHVPSFVRLGSKPLRALREVEEPIEYLRPYLRDGSAACAYAPNQVRRATFSIESSVTAARSARAARVAVNK